MPDFEMPQDMPAQQNIDTTRLNSLLLASTLMQTMRARTEEAQHALGAYFKPYKALRNVHTKLHICFVQQCCPHHVI